MIIVPYKGKKKKVSRVTIEAEEEAPGCHAAGFQDSRKSPEPAAAARKPGTKLFTGAWP